MVRHLKVCAMVTSFALLFMCIAIFLADMSPWAPGRAVVRLTADKPYKYISVGDGFYYDPDTYIVYTGISSPYDYGIPIPVRTTDGRPYVFNPHTGEMEAVN